MSCNGHSQSHYHSHCKKNPDLVFYFSSDVNKGTIIDKLKFGNSVLETVYGYLTDKNSKNIGRLATTKMNYDVNDVNKNNIYDITEDKTFYLKNGTITIIFPSTNTKDSQGNIVSLSGTTITRIVTGTGVYLNKKGYVKIKRKNLNRKISIYFTN
jgi:hypothetical protein